MLQIKDVSKENLNDALNVCSGSRAIAPVDNPVLEKSREFKKHWFTEMINSHGSCAKLGYFGENPVAQIIFYPEEATPYLHNPRRDALYIKCIFNSNLGAQRKGVADSLMKALIEECWSGLKCLEGRSCQFIVTRPFPHEGELPLNEFYKKYGFKEGHKEMYLEINGKYSPMNVPMFQPLPEDRGKTIIMYNVDCEWGYFYAVSVRDLIKGKYPEHPVEIYNSWEKPEEYKRRGGGWMNIAAGIIVNAQIPPPFLFWKDQQAYFRNLEKLIK